MPRTQLDRFEQRKLTRQKLIEAALKLFSTSGYEHATVDDISNAAGYSKGAYYFHFSTKDDILLELLRMWTEGRTTVLMAGAEAGASPREALQQTLTNFFSYRDTPQWPGVLLEFWAQGVRNQDVAKRLSEAYAGWRRQLSEMFQRAEAQGVVHLTTADDAAAVTLAAHDGYAVQTAIGGPSGRAITPDELAEQLITPLETPETGRRAAAL